MAVAILRYWDHIEVCPTEDILTEDLQNILTMIPGIHHILEVDDCSYTDIYNIFEQTYSLYKDTLKGKSFCVRVKRRGTHTFSSMEIENYVGAGLKNQIEGTSVSLCNPQITINLEIQNDRLLLIQSRHKGLGGYPIGTQEDVLSLISGGFDSSVSSYMLMRRGCRVHYCFFNLGGFAHEIVVKQVACYLWDRFGSSHRVRFLVIDLAPIVSEIQEKIKYGHKGIILKRMMVRAAAILAEKYSCQALITGESLGQVSSQTLSNLHLIDHVTNMLILRPLISHDKEDIVSMARDIGTENLVKNMPEFCSVFSERPTIKGVRSHIESEENDFDFNILKSVITDSRSMDLGKFIKTNLQLVVSTQSFRVLRGDELVLDIRSIDFQEKSPLNIKGLKVISLPFYKIASQFSNLDQSVHYLLYCNSGVMSRIQVLYLKERGYNNVSVYYP
ncbi:tRNA sulfurtransferase [Candidatus Profftia tarda]|uniref:tRNA sulfurtransferase n=1 Tax=Candidatus Profftia tarda TaxID=1177216 RepID=A0A8E4GIY8_9ENTR|nr:tRNA sulfurtransferase [Candidatus Profftia tarda]